MATPASGLTLFYQSTYWRIWSTSAFISANSAAIAAFQTYGDQFIPQMIADFGFSIFPLKSGDSSDGIHMDLVLDVPPNYPSGLAQAGTVFGSAGVTMDANFVNDNSYGVTAFYFRLLWQYESVNSFTGFLAQGWPWADGSSLWGGSSPFPNMVSIIVPSELGQTALSTTQAGRELPDNRVVLFYNLWQSSGWTVYRKFFNLIQTEGVTDWYNWPEPLRTSVLAFLLVYSGAPTTLYQDWMNAGIAITSSSIADAQAQFPNLSPITFTIAANPTSVTLGQSIAFDFSSPITGGVSPYTYLWNFGDGTTSTLENPAHTYTVAKSYSVVVTVTDATTGQAAGVINVVVNPKGGTGSLAVLTGASVVAVGLLYASSVL